MSKIIFLEGEFFCLNLLHYTHTKYNGEYWISPEHAITAARCSVPSTQVTEYWKQIRSCKTPEQARRLGRRLPKRKDWDQIKDTVLEEIVINNITTIPHLKQKLKDTKDSLILNVEDTEFGCSYDLETGLIKGKNKLGSLLQKIRGTLC